VSARVCLIEGDGIGAEVIPAARQVLEYICPDMQFTCAEAGWGTFQRYGNALPQATLDAVSAADATLFGAVSSPSGPAEGYRSPIVGLRRHFDLYANLRPVMSQPITGSRPGIDMLIVRENSEGLYSGIERREGDRAVTERVITRSGSERIVRRAAELAMARRRHLTIVHKANVLRATCGLFREVALEVVGEFPLLAVDEQLVDAAAMRLIMAPEGYDVLVTTNLFGDILSDEAAALVGGLGLAPSANIGARCAIFEPVHGSAPDIAGKGIANPLAAFAASAMLLDHIAQPTRASLLRAAIDRVLRQGPRTPDLGGEAGTDDVTKATLAALEEATR
jgi:homoisocitrate dehydrogenase